MNTPTHALFALAILARRGRKGENRAVLFGALLPDLAVFLWAPWQYFIRGQDGATIWQDLYFAPPMQLIIAPFNSIPILLLVSLLGWLKRGAFWGRCVMLIGLAGLLHILLDVPFHGHDAYRHFWPLSDWRFHSPLSYWEADNHAAWVTVLEAVLGVTCIAILWRRFPARWVKIILSGLALAYVAMLLLYWLPLGQS